MSQKAYETGSRNVSRDLGVPNAEEHLIKAQLLFKIDTIMKQGRMKQAEAADPKRRSVSHLEALGRLTAGIAPWIELAADGSDEGRLRAEYAALTRRAIARAVDPSSSDFLSFTHERQPLVDAAFLAQGVLRAPRALGDALDPPARRNLVAALEATRSIVPAYNNWLLFAATVEAALGRLGAPWDRVRVDYALRQHERPGGHA